MRVIQYATVAASSDENERLVKAVFKELSESANEDIRYAVLRIEGGGFVHLVAQNSPTKGLTTLASFQEFQTGIKSRVVASPIVSEAKIVGNHRLLAELEADRP